MSNLRLLSVIIGIGLLLVSLTQLRFQHWRFKVILIVFGIGAGLSIVGLWPDSLAGIAKLLGFGTMEWARIQTLILIGCALNYALVVASRSKIDQNKQKTDLFLMSMIVSQADLTADKEKSVAILVPALNEAENLAKLLPRIPRRLPSGHLTQVVVIDDGSTDQTAAVSREYGALVISSPVNLGQGFALRVGYQFLKLNSQFLAGVTMDADNQHKPEDLPNLLDPVLSGAADLVIGSRKLAHGSNPNGTILRSLGISVFSATLLALTGKRITDCSSGFKAFNRAWLNSIVLHEEQFQAAEVILRTCWSKLILKEVPITIDKREHGTTKKGSDWRYGLNFARSIVRTIFR